MALLVALLLAQVPSPPCGMGLECSFGGYRSFAPLYYGSGAPDFTCGMADDLPDGGWGPGSKYCMIRTHESSSYSGWHPDLTVSSYNPRSAGLLLGVENSYWSPGAVIWAVDFAGNTYQTGRVFVSGNGAGVQNLSSYVGVRGQSTSPGLIADVMLAPSFEHHDGGWLVDVWNGPVEAPFRVRDDGALSISGIVLRVTTNNDALYLTQELPDGGSRTAVMRWAQ